jgi:hypothetical protein
MEGGQAAGRKSAGHDLGSTALPQSPIERLNPAFQLDRYRISLAVHGFAGRYGNPTFADAILLDIRKLFIVELNSDFVSHDICIVVAATWVNGEAIRERRKLNGVVHGVDLQWVKKKRKSKLWNFKRLEIGIARRISQGMAKGKT